MRQSIYMNGRLNGHWRLLLSMFILTLYLLVSARPGYAQSDPNAAPAGAGMSPDVATEPFNAAVEVPTHESPAPNTVSTAITDPPVGVPTLSWLPVAGATRYNVQLSVSEGFATTIVNQTTVATTFTHKEALVDGTYFWRVRAEVNKEWGNYSEPWSFRKDWSAEGLIKPVLIAPADDPNGVQPITSFSPEQFSWEPVPGAAAYELEISLSPSFNDLKPYRATTIKPHHTPTQQFSNNQYYWRVVPVDSRDHAGVPSDVRTFTFSWNQVPELLTPENNPDDTPDEVPGEDPEDSRGLRFIPRFSWTAVSGASSYILEISSQENFSDPKSLTSIATKNTSYTPEVALGNNQDYFWRVRAVSPRGINSQSSQVRRFRAKWVEPPVLLSPPVRSINHIYPYFSWTPVAGAEKYQIQIATGTGFANVVVDITLNNATSYTQPEWKEIIFGGDYFWHVRAKDAQGNTTSWSNEQSFRFSTTPPPNLIYPEPYYEPDALGMPVHTNRTIAYPFFVWDTTHEWISEVNNGNGPVAFIYPDYYRLEVATSREFNNIVFSIDSAGQAAVPTKANPFNFTDKTLYYWRVTPIRDGLAMAEGTVWETRLDRTVPQLPFDTDTSPDISHPQNGFISVDTAPILGWLPVVGADHYEVQISSDRKFSVIVDGNDTLSPYYAPWQGRQTPMPHGAYWWHVRARDASGSPLGDWSESRRFLVTDDLITGNEYDYAIPEGGTLLSTGDPFTYDATLSMVATNTITVAAPYNLGSLHIAQDRSISANNRNWVVAFGADSGVSGSLTYALYFDVNQLEGVGGPGDPLGKPIVFDDLYLPDYVIYLQRTDDFITNATFYEWTGSSWEASSLGGLGGTYTYDSLSQSVQVVFPYTTIILSNEDQFSGAIALTVYSTPSDPASAPIDSVPVQGAEMNKPALVSNMPVPLFPFDTPLSNPVVFHEMPTLRWRMPHYNSIDGYTVQIARNADFTLDGIVETWETFESNTTSYYGGAPTAFRTGKSYSDDESYYWRVRYRHERYDGRDEYDVSPWSQPMRFKLTSYQPGNPTITLGNPALGEAAQATPSFTWERVEGAAKYSIQIDNDFNMDNPITNKTIDGNSFTALDTLPDGTYYWRVAMRRSANVLGQWTSIMSFTKTSLVPTLISPLDDFGIGTNLQVMSDTVVNSQPTFIWATTISNTGELHVAAPRYRLQWDDNEQFNSPTTVETESTSYTPIQGQSLADGTWFWRVAIIDGNGRRGPDSEVASFYKEYLRPQTLSPVQGSGGETQITFEWSPLGGAASYVLEIDDNEAFDKPIRVNTENTRYTHIDKFAPGDYYWRVQMVDKDKKPGPTIPGRFSQGPEAGSTVFMPMVLAP